MRVSVVFLSCRIRTLIFTENVFLSPCTLWTVFLVHVFSLTCTPIPQRVISKEDHRAERRLNTQRERGKCTLSSSFFFVQGVELFTKP